jgi:hypothetical protein
VRIAVQSEARFGNLAHGLVTSAEIGPHLERFVAATAAPTARSADGEDT